MQCLSRRNLLILIAVLVVLGVLYHSQSKKEGFCLTCGMYSDCKCCLYHPWSVKPDYRQK